MQIDNNILKTDERVAYTLRSLYSRFGYCQYKMSKFEEYALYVKNKDFLPSEGIISFPDMSGRLLALKPDVTLSIINNSKDREGEIQKLYYDENVYRIPRGSHSFKEIRQTGLECIGDIGIFEMCEVIALALRSLAAISDTYILELAHVGVVEAVLDDFKIPDTARKEILPLIDRKNRDGLWALCASGIIDENAANAVDVLMRSYSDADGALSAIKGLCVSARACKCLDRLSRAIEFVRDMGLIDRVKIDFSLTGENRYYSGIAFRGYINGIPAAVLSGGRYDRLMQRMGRTSGAIGFAVYLDRLERMNMTGSEFDADILLIHDGDIASAIKKADVLSADGRTVRISHGEPKGIRCRETVRLTGEEK